MANMTEKTDAELQEIMYADSGYDGDTVTKAFREYKKRNPNIELDLQDVTGGREQTFPEAPPPKPDSVKKKAGGVVKKRIGATDYRKGGYVLSTMDNRKVKRNGK
jgi:hypothetical protein